MGETTDEAGHADNSVGDGNTASVNVVQRENQGRAGEGEETTAENGSDIEEDATKEVELTEVQGYR